MEAKSNADKKPILARIAERLLKDQEELDALAVQLSLGKAEARDQFDEVKKKLKLSVHDFKVELLKEYNQGKTTAGNLKQKLENLEQQLSEKRIDTRELFNEQKQNLMKALEEVKHEIQNDPDLLKMAGFFTSATEKAKLQFEILDKKWDSAREELKGDFKDEMKTARFKINDIIQNAKDKKEELGEKLDDFNAEIHEAYTHLKKAVKSL